MAREREEQQAAPETTPAAAPVSTPAGFSPVGMPQTPAGILALQRAAGNRAVTALLQRNGPTTAGPPAPPVPAAAPAAPAAADPQQDARMLRASTTLKKVPPLGENESKLLEKAIPGALVFAHMKERDQKRRDLEDLTRRLEQGKKEIGTKPEHGVPATQEDLDRWSKEIEDITKEVERLDVLVKAGLEPLGVANEAELATLISERFPKMFVERAKQIAITELDANRAIVEEEMHRYGLDACVDPAAQQALKAAAAELLAKDRRLQEIQDQLSAARLAADPPSAGVPDPSGQSSSQVDVNRLQAELEKEGNERSALETKHALAHPILLKHPDLSAIANGDEEAFTDEVGGKLKTILENIEDTKKNISDGSLKVWNLNEIVELTKQDLGVTGNQVLEDAVQKLVKDEESDEAVVKIALAALALTAAIVATVATAGSAAALGGAVVAGAVSGYTAADSVKKFMAEGAASNVALDPAVQDLSKKEPELGWLIVDLVGAGLDAVQLVSAFNQLRKAALVARETGAIVEFAEAAKAALPPAQAEKVIASVTRQAGVRAAVGRQIKAIGTKFKKADLAAIGREIRKHADEGFSAVYENLRKQGRISPLNEKSLRKVLSKERADAQIAAGALEKDGLYLGDSGSHLFIKDGSLHSVSSTVVHEATHWIQRTQGAGLTRFSEEFQAFSMEQRYLKELFAKSGRNLDVIPGEMLWLLGASEERIAAHIAAEYTDCIRPVDLDMAKEVGDVLKRLGAFTAR